MIASRRAALEPTPPPARALIVEDDFAVREGLAKTLRAAGYEVVTAADGAAAFALLHEAHFDAIVCDILMPHMDGMKLFERLREEDPDAAKHMVFVTGWSEEPPVATFLDQSGRPHLDKPVDRDDLLSVLRGLVAEAEPPPGEHHRNTFAPFAPDEAAAIRQIIVTEGAALVCPRCGEKLECGEPIGGGGSMELVWLLECRPCRRSMVVRDLPDTPCG